MEMNSNNNYCRSFLFQHQFTKATHKRSEYDKHQLSSSFIMQKAHGENRKIEEGPCAVEFELVAQCAQHKGLKDPKRKLESCPSETDRLIRCINKHPKFLYT
ncbi:hypothetical protein MHU86_6911 [Fragilaria crotonensis]|nr:hypothetical protein MHU86_6911 [Fragilaria crotonensis]